MYKKTMGDRFSEWMRGYRSRPGDEADNYDEEFYDEDEYDEAPVIEDYDDGYQGFSDDDFDDEENNAPKSERFSFSSRKAKNQRGRDRADDRSARSTGSNHGTPKIYSMDRGANPNIKIETPTRFDGVTKNIIDVIRSGSTLIVNLEQVSRQDFIRFLDFLAGAVYIMESDMQYVTDRILIIAPKSVSLAGGERKEIYDVEPMASIY